MGCGCGKAPDWPAERRAPLTPEQEAAQRLAPPPDDDSIFWRGHRVPDPAATPKG